MQSTEKTGPRPSAAPGGTQGAGGLEVSAGATAPVSHRCRGGCRTGTLRVEPRAAAWRGRRDPSPALPPSYLPRLFRSRCKTEAR